VACLCRHHPCVILLSRGRPAVASAGRPACLSRAGYDRPPSRCRRSWPARGPGRARSSDEAGSAITIGQYRGARGRPGAFKLGRRGPPSVRSGGIFLERLDRERFSNMLKLNHMTQRVAKAAFPYPTPKVRVSFDALCGSCERAWLRPARLNSTTEAVAMPDEGDPRLMRPCLGQDRRGSAPSE
jgi:hypothetical protein